MVVAVLPTSFVRSLAKQTLRLSIFSLCSLPSKRTAGAELGASVAELEVAWLAGMLTARLEGL